MDSALLVLTGTAASIAVLHTLTGPDHYIPFVAMSRIGRWSMPKTIVITLICGVGHVLSSVVIGVTGIALGLAVSHLEKVESHRGNLAGWLLLGFGLAYMAWGIKRALRHRPHTHAHAHAGGLVHEHSHGHEGEHLHVHAGEPGGEHKAARMTPWILFTIFVFGPCEPLIPVLMFPAAQQSLFGILLVTLVFALCTLATMTVLVVCGTLGLQSLSLGRLGRYSHALAGLALAACGAAVQFGL